MELPAYLFKRNASLFVLQWPVPALPRHALSACLCLEPMPASPWLHLPLCPSIIMCARIIVPVAGTALQAAPPTFVFACVIDLVHFKGGAWDCIGQPATFLFLHREPDTAFGQPGSLLQEWPVGWHMAC